MSRLTRRTLIASVAVAGGGAGCLDSLRAGAGRAGPATPLPNETVALPDGPKSPPERPSTLSVDSVREFALLYEYRYAYNTLWRDDDSAVSLSCHVLDATAFDRVYRVAVSCSGHAETEARSVPDASGPTPVRDEWPERTVTYLVDEDSVIRQAGPPTE